MTILEDTTRRHQQTFQLLLNFVGTLGVPEERIQTMKERVRIEDPIKLKSEEPSQIAISAISALYSLQAYSKCYPYMDNRALITKCADAWEALSARNHAARQYINRKVMTMRMDPKADPNVLEHLEALKVNFDKSCTIVNIGLYRIRVLKSLHDNKKVTNKD